MVIIWNLTLDCCASPCINMFPPPTTDLLPPTITRPSSPVSCNQEVSSSLANALHHTTNTQTHVQATNPPPSSTTIHTLHVPSSLLVTPLLHFLPFLQNLKDGWSWRMIEGWSVKKCQILHNSCYCSYTSFEYTLVWDSLFLDAITLMKKGRKFV